MTADAFRYALSHITPLAGRTLWLYGDAALAMGDVYHPFQNKAQLPGPEGYKVFSDIAALGKHYDAAFVNCPKGREEAIGLMALAFDRARGLVMAAAPNDAGGGRLIKMMEAYGVLVSHISKSKCRVVWTMHANSADQTLIKQNLSYLDPQPITLEGKTWWSAPGLFGWNKIDPGSTLLLEHLPPDIAGYTADFGCGYGYLSVLLEQRYPALSTIDAYDIDARAVSCCARNGGTKINAIWQDIYTLNAPGRYDTIVMNPPFHSNKEEDLNLGRAFIVKAWESLKAGGRLFMVANKHLAYERAVPQLAIICEGSGYKLMSGRKS